MAKDTKKKKKKTLSSDQKEDRAIEKKVDKEAAADEAAARSKSTEFYKDGVLTRLEAPPQVAEIAAPKEIEKISNVMPGADQSIAQAEDAYAKAQQRDKYVEQALANLQAGLGGYASAENQALRAQLSRATRGTTATMLRALKGSQAAAGVTGDSASGQAMSVLKAAASDRATQETDILTKNVEEQRLRGTAFANAATNADQVMRTAQDAALQRLLGIRTDVANYGQRADIANQGAEGTNITNALTAAVQNSGIQRGNLDAIRDTAIFNAGQSEKEMAGRQAAYYGEVGARATRRADIANRGLARRQLAAAERGV